MSEKKDAQEQQDHDESASSSTPSSESPERSSNHASSDQAQADSGAVDEPRESGGGGNATAWLAMLLALGALGLAGWQWWLSETDDGSAGFVSRIDEQASALQTQSQRLEQFGERMETAESRLDTLAGELDSSDFDPAELRRQLRSQASANDDLQQRVDALSERVDEAISNLESSIEQTGSARSGQIEESHDEAAFRLGLIEVASLLRLGQLRAELAVDPAGAIAAYERAQSRLEGIQDERATRLRQLVARELEALRSVEETDWPELAGQLSGLEAESAQWPMSGATEGAAAENGSGAPGGEAAEAEGGWWSKLRSSMGGLVRVTPRESAPLTPAAVESVRQRVRLHLAAAQAAAARRSVDELTRHLEVAGELIRAHFDTSAQAVARALESISEAASIKAPSLPDLGGALAEAERRLAAS